MCLGSGGKRMNHPHMKCSEILSYTVDSKGGSNNYLFMIVIVNSKRTDG